MVYGVEPDLTREGGSIPVTLTLQEATGKNVILLPMGASDDSLYTYFLEAHRVCPYKRIQVIPSKSKQRANNSLGPSLLRENVKKNKKETRPRGYF